MIRALPFILLLFTASSFGAIQPPIEASSIPSLGGRGALTSASDIGALDDRYRLGDEWGKKPVDPTTLAREDRVFQRTAFATAKVNGATGFYLGVFAGKHIVATNHHVCPYGFSCIGTTVRFPMLNKSFRASKLLGSWPTVDLALLVIDVANAADAQTLQSVAGNFNFRAPIYPGQELLTIGFGIGDNPNQQMVANRDSDCKVFSQRDEFRLMADPDDLNPGNYQAWSFANGCDVSHGDSGSAMVDRRTGDVVGIIWTGRIPKSASVQSSAHLNELLAHPTEEIWKELSYSVPASKMAEYLRAQIASGNLNEETRQILTEIWQ